MPGLVPGIHAFAEIQQGMRGWPGQARPCSGKEVNEFHGHGYVMPQFTNLGALIDRTRDLSKTAIIDLGGNHPGIEYTYAQIDAGANGVANALRRQGLARGDRVAILSANRTEYLVTYFGIMRAGLVAVPVNYRFPRQTIHFIIKDCGAKLVFCDGPRLTDCPPALPVVNFSKLDLDSRHDDVPGFLAFLGAGEFDAVVPRPD